MSLYCVLLVMRTRMVPSLPMGQPGTHKFMTPFGHDGLKCYAPSDAQGIDDIVTLGVGEMGHYILMYEDELPTLHFSQNQR